MVEIDGMKAAQVSAQYFISSNWTVGLCPGGAAGGPGTVYGSLPRATSGLPQIVRYLSPLFHFQFMLLTAKGKSAIKYPREPGLNLMV
jgi:hypothetical protein